MVVLAKVYLCKQDLARQIDDVQQDIATWHAGSLLSPCNSYYLTVVDVISWLQRRSRRIREAAVKDKQCVYTTNASMPDVTDCVFAQ